MPKLPVENIKRYANVNLLTRESQKCWQIEGIGFQDTATHSMALVVHCTMGLIIFRKCVRLRCGGGSHW